MCRLIALSEMSFIDLLREKQKERAYKILGMYRRRKTNNFSAVYNGRFCYLFIFLIYLGAGYVDTHQHINPESVNFQVLRKVRVFFVLLLFL
jgi:hypothetical protein